jgi:NADH-ubiquinone oxidoreductase chain 5
MGIPLIILGILSIIFGYLAKDFFIGLGSESLGFNLFTHPFHLIILDTEFGIPIFYKLLPVILCLLFGSLALFIYECYPLIITFLLNSHLGKNIFRFFNQRY